LICHALLNIHDREIVLFKIKRNSIEELTVVVTIVLLWNLAHHHAAVSANMLSRTDGKKYHVLPKSVPNYVYSQVMMSFLNYLLHQTFLTTIAQYIGVQDNNSGIKEGNGLELSSYFTKSSSVSNVADFKITRKLCYPIETYYCMFVSIVPTCRFKQFNTILHCR